MKYYKKEYFENVDDVIIFSCFVKVFLEQAIIDSGF